MLKELQANTLYTNQEIAEWFGLKGKRFSSADQKERKLEQLKLFADYQLRGNKIKKIFIKEVYQPRYNKKGSASYQIIQNNFIDYWSDHGNGLDTVKRVGQAMYTDGLVENITCGTVVEYAGRVKREGWGKNYVSSGSKGYSVYAWGKYVQDENGSLRLVPLTKEEEEIKNKLIKKYFGNTTEKQIFVQGMVRNGEITKEQAWEVLEQLTGMEGKFQAFRAEFSVAINSAVGQGTYLITDRRESAF